MNTARDSEGRRQDTPRGRKSIPTVYDNDRRRQHDTTQSQRLIAMRGTTPSHSSAVYGSGPWNGRPP